MLVGQRISQIPPYGLQNYIAGILAALERICHCDRHGLFTLSVLILNFAMKPPYVRGCVAEEKRTRSRCCLGGIVSGTRSKQRFEKHLRIGTRFDGSRFVLLDGSPLPTLTKDSIVDLILAPESIVDSAVRARFL